MFHSAIQTSGMNWKEIWKSPTGEDAPRNEVNSIQGTGTSVDFMELFNPGNFSSHKGDLIPGTILDMTVNPEFDLILEERQEQARERVNRENPLILIGAAAVTVFSSMQNINAKHNIGEAWEEKCTQGLSMLEFAISMYWDQIERGRFFLHEHPANATSWSLPQVQQLERHPGVQVVVGDMCRWGMKVASDERNEGDAKLVKKPTKWMTNSPLLAKLLQARCSGDHEHQRLEGSNLTEKAASYPIPLVKSTLGVVRQLKRNKVDANLSKDPVHLMIPETFQQWEDHITVSRGRKTMSNFDCTSDSSHVGISCCASNH